MEFTYPDACPNYYFPLLSSTETLASEEFYLILRYGDGRFIEDDSTSEDVGTASGLPNSSSERVKTGNSNASGSGDLGPYLAEMRRFKIRCIGGLNNFMEVTGHTYDQVFLIFHGQDTRSSFLSLLYDVGIHAFKDDDEIEGKEILPIFYKATTDVVKLRTDEYMKQLSSFQIWKKAFSSIPDCRGWQLLLNNLNRLKKKLVYVRSLTIKDCASLERLSHLSELRNLTKLTLLKCDKLREIQCLEDLESVKQLVIRHCSSLERLPNLFNLGLLERLHIEKCKKLKEIDGLESVFLRYLHIGYCNSLERLGINPLEMNRLEYVCIEFCNSLREIHNVSGKTQLISSEVKPTDIGGIASLAEQDSDSSDSNSVKEDGFAAQYSVAGLDNHHLRSSSDEEESGRTIRGSSSNSESAAAAKAFLKRFFTGGIETLSGSVDLVPVVAAAKALLQINGDHFWDDFSYKVDETSSSYKQILESTEAAESAHAKYGKLKEFAVEMRNDYRSVKSRMDQVHATKEKALSEINTLRARLIELENTVIQADQQLQIATSERQVLVTRMKEQVRVMRATEEEIQCRDAECDASRVRLNSLKAQWDSWAAHLDLLD